MGQFSRVAQIRKGAPITARLLNSYAGAINNLQVRVGAVEQELVVTDVGDRPEVSTFGSGTSVSGESRTTDLLDMLEAQDAAAPDEFFIEVSRVTDTVRVEDPDDPEVFVDVERITVVTLRSLTGRVMTQVFDNS